MIFTPTRRHLLGALAAVAVLGGAPAAGAAFPDRPIRLIVPYAPGGPTDAIARVVSNHLSQRLGQSVVIENRDGAGGNIGMQAAAAAPPDGYTLFFATTGTMAINPALYRSLKLDTAKAFDPVGAVAYSWNVLTVLPTFPAGTLPELIALAKAQPGKLTYGSAGSGAPSHLSMELLKMTAGIDVLHVPYRGSAPAIVDLLGGRIDMMFDSTLTQTPLVTSGKVKALVQSAKVRAEALSDVPTVEEAGFKGFEVTNFFGIVAPHGAPDAAMERVNRELNLVLAQDDVKKAFAAFGAIPLPISRAEFGARIRDEIGMWSKLVKESGASVD